MTDSDMKEITCRGSMMLGTGCGTCSRCKKELETMRQKLKEAEWESKKDQPAPQGPVGWICPRCGRGNGPFASTCPCVPLPPPVVTC